MMQYWQTRTFALLCRFQYFFFKVTLREVIFRTPFFCGWKLQTFCKFGEGNFSGARTVAGSSAPRGDRRKRKTSSMAAAERDPVLRQCCRYCDALSRSLFKDEGLTPHDCWALYWLAVLSSQPTVGTALPKDTHFTQDHTHPWESYTQ